MEYQTIINGFPYLPKNERKKILLCSDDLRMSSGVGTVSRELVVGTAHYFNWVQIGGAVTHPENGKRIDVSEAVNKESGITDASVVIYPVNGYGTMDFIRQLFEFEKPNAIMPYTDPRFWVWLWQHEHEIRQKMPILFYHVWDDLPFPKYNEGYYESNDWIGCISKQTYNIVKNVWTKNPPKPYQITYIPHGINHRTFYPFNFENPGKEHEVPSGKNIQVPNEKGEMIEKPEMVKKTDYEIYIDLRKKFFGDDDPEFVLLYVNRNVRRKMTSDVVLAYNKFCDELSPEKAKKCALLMHTMPVDEAGTDLPAMIEGLGIRHRIIFSDGRIEPRFMNIIYNIADVTINLASNEGFGLGTAESLMAGTPIIVNVTGGLQDQCGFLKDDGTPLTIDDYNEHFGSNHEGRYKKHGKWVKPIFPATISLQGSIPTPYIFDDRCRWQDVALLIREWYDMGREKRKDCGVEGRKFMMRPEIEMTTDGMCRRFMTDITTAINNWKPRKRFELVKIWD